MEADKQGLILDFKNELKNRSKKDFQFFIRTLQFWRGLREDRFLLFPFVSLNRVVGLMNVKNDLAHYKIVNFSFTGGPANPNHNYHLDCSNNYVDLFRCHIEPGMTCA